MGQSIIFFYLTHQLYHNPRHTRNRELIQTNLLLLKSQQYQKTDEYLAGYLSAADARQP